MPGLGDEKKKRFTWRLRICAKKKAGVIMTPAFFGRNSMSRRGRKQRLKFTMRCPVNNGHSHLKWRLTVS